MHKPGLVALVAVAAVAGFLFAAVSTYDFTAHLDRQVHGIHCSFLPGMGAADLSGSSGCHVTLMSHYSSVLRDEVWGGIPIALPAMAVFAFIAFWLAALVITRRLQDDYGLRFLVASTSLPLLSSAVMAYISFAELGAACRLCIGIYVSSVAVFAGAVLMWLRRGDAPPDAPAALSIGALAGALAAGIAFVALPIVAYAAYAPSFERFVGACGELPKAASESSALIPLGDQRGGVVAVEVLDPLCAACRAFERRFVASSLASKVARKAVLFPLDNACNWMIDSAIHPGACAITEAVLCAGARADDVLSWAFDEQERIMEATRTDPKAAAAMAAQRFPELRGCLGSAKVKSRVNLGLRWAVANQLPVLTPQFYVGGQRLCDEDTDLGMEYVTARLIARAGGER